MRRRHLIAVVIGICAFSGTSLAAEQVGPTVRVADTSPFMVRGSRFEPAERVKVTVFAKTTAVKTTQASSVGSFVVRFRGIDLGYCPAYSVSAVGNKGSRAAIKRRAPECPPPPPDPAN